MFSDKIKKHYSAIAKVYKEFLPKIQALSDEVNEALTSAIGEEDEHMTIPSLISVPDWVQVYVNNPSEDAVFRHGDEENKYYDLTVDGVRFTECVGVDPYPYEE